MLQNSRVIIVFFISKLLKYDAQRNNFNIAERLRVYEENVTACFNSVTLPAINIKPLIRGKSAVILTADILSCAALICLPFCHVLSYNSRWHSICF
jgi:hypothetical protein